MKIELHVAHSPKLGINYPPAKVAIEQSNPEAIVLTIQNGAETYTLTLVQIANGEVRLVTDDVEIAMAYIQ